MYKFVVLFICMCSVISAEQINQLVINKNVERTIDLTSQLVKITATITLENTGKDTVRNYLIVLEPDTVGNLSYISVKDSLKEDLKLTPSKVEKHEKDVYSVQLKQPLATGRTAGIILEAVFTKGLVPYPNSITQKEKQLVRYFGNHYFYTPYATSKQTTSVTLSSRSVESYTKLKPVSQSDSTLTYGPYSDIPAFSQDRMIVHYENNSPFLTVTRLERLIEISHWGNIAVEENIEILHTGAKLKGPFSRYDYQRDTGSSHHSIKSYRTILPAAAYNIYYRDSNGNISTSQVRTRKDWIELELRPRFPLFGGWRSSYTLGYSVPSYQYLYRKSSTEYVLNMRLLDHVFDDMHVEELETKVVLPVGVTEVQIKTPYEVQRLPDGVTFKYLDQFGRSVIKLRKTNLVEQHIQDLEIVYHWRSGLLLLEPVLLALALYVLFIIVIIYVRLDFSIHKPEHAKKE
ncbi:dolichyl-diphosphooligosaccharide--protein glycosyltransferase subunit 1 [Tribolium castaneum]|uniref:Dolichyl-diphosphooligosaccharide--protein glycosyltransferase subunit 1 n=1 Tax=Tribolium castaneum TaxID=7070 RepID=D6W7G4_TRICA|nr:PREDICTED: dolichyl-diphosphooligosaccharide--protein glycosyltransferase subunit 1 [Tribolium castaneum]EFA11223.1 Dolichyl-diphosphooligosaccharide--protein glycosyltransferase subunit 1-like Protein [Tribolium castaneum]|eukprot:XP_972905.1 PREDICTED: dolichyl-diphosphooligosaccharide--protein glycosyltransferase subunit 1 [Tribolium castaneum]